MPRRGTRSASTRCYAMSTIKAMAARLSHTDGGPRGTSNRSNRTAATALFDHLRVFRRVRGVRMLSEHGRGVLARYLLGTCAALVRYPIGASVARDSRRASE